VRRIINRQIVFLSIILAGIFSAGKSAAAVYSLNSNAAVDSVLFESTAKLEFIEGKTKAVEGYFTFNPEKSTDSITGIIRVDLTTLKTGIDTRDQHMRDNYLETDKYPYAFFELVSIPDIPAVITAGKEYTVTGEGNFYIHEVYRKLHPSITFTVHEGGELVQIETSFSINLEDYDIERPKLVFMKLAKTINVRLFLTGFLSENKKEIVLPSSFKAK